LSRDQSSLAALNIAGLAGLDSTFALAMAVVAVAIFVFGLLLQRRREYVTLRAQGLEARTIGTLIAAEASTVAIGGAIVGLLVGTGMGLYFVSILRPLFVLSPTYSLPLAVAAVPVALVAVATIVASIAASRLVNSLDPTELLRDE
jgi:ABC-type antimicrobial peptide transport system permease subunit